MRLIAMNPMYQALFWSLDTSQVIYSPPGCQEGVASVTSMMLKENWNTKIVSDLLSVIGLPIVGPRLEPRQSGTEFFS